ncbi:MAG: hydroxyacid dehydrogenase [Peptococcaceae bacterium]|nr:hydroxyacid dehydrogenase [Peptococcaceae bacterium]
MKKYKVLLTESISPVGIGLLQEKAQVVTAPSPAEGDLLPLIGDADALLVRSSPVTAGLLEAGKKLKVVGRHGIGLDNIDLRSATRLGIPVVHTPGANTNAVAEHALWAMMHCARNFNKAEKAFRRGEFCRAGSLPGLVQKMGYTTMELKGKVLGLVGMGRIARRLSEIAGRCLEMRVKAYDPLVPEEVFASAGVERCRTLDAALSGADFVSLHVPYTKETHHLIGERELSLMKPTGYLINTSRGGIVDEEALYMALRDGRLAGAALDVFETEPPAADIPLFGLDNVLLTPHMAAMTDLALVNMAADVASGILDVLEGRRPQYLANPEVWGSSRIL